MPTEYNPYTNTTTPVTPTSAQTERGKTWTYIAVAVVVLGIVAMFAMPGNQSGDSTTSGAPPAASDTLPPAATEAMPTTPMPSAPAPAAPY